MPIRENATYKKVAYIMLIVSVSTIAFVIFISIATANSQRAYKNMTVTSRHNEVAFSASNNENESLSSRSHALFALQNEHIYSVIHLFQLPDILRSYTEQVVTRKETIPTHVMPQSPLAKEKDEILSNSSISLNIPENQNPNLSITVNGVPATITPDLNSTQTFETESGMTSISTDSDANTGDEDVRVRVRTSTRIDQKDR